MTATVALRLPPARRPARSRRSARRPHGLGGRDGLGGAARLGDRAPDAPAQLDPRQLDSGGGIPREDRERGARIATAASTLPSPSRAGHLDERLRRRLRLPGRRVERQPHRDERARAVPGQLARVRDARVRGEAGAEPTIRSNARKASP